MNRNILLLLVTVQISSLSGWAGQEGTSDIERKQKVNFFGTITTQQGNTLEIENLSINNRYQQILMYEKPMDVQVSTKAQSDDSGGTVKKEVRLSSNPKDSALKDWIDLDQVIKIEVINPNEIWFYQKKDKSRKIYFIEVAVTKKNGSIKSLLMKLENEPESDQSSADRDQIKFHQVSDNKTEKMSLPLLGLKSLTIKGFCSRDTDTTPRCVSQDIQKAQEK